MHRLYHSKYSNVPSEALVKHCDGLASRSKVKLPNVDPLSEKCPVFFEAIYEQLMSSSKTDP